MHHHSIAATLALATTTILCAQQPFWIAQLPDTQHYTTDAATRMPHFFGMTAHLALWRPDFVSQIGDLTENALDVEFQRAMAAMALLDQAQVPYRICAGNHDYVGGRKPDLTTFHRWVGPSTNWFEHSQFLAINLEWHPADTEIQWARQLIEQHPDKPVFLSTHEFIGGNSLPPSRSPIGSDLDSDGDNSAEQTWQKLVVPYPQVSMVLCGHKYGEGVRTDVTPFGRTVHQILFNAQDDPYGGQGFMRLIGFTGREIGVLTLSMSYRGLLPDRTGFFRLPWNLGPIPQVVHVRSGADTFVIPVWPGSTRTTYDQVFAASTGALEKGLLRFNLPASLTTCTKALLTLTFEGYGADGDGLLLYRMRRSWNDTDSWQSLGGLQIGIDTEPVADAVTGPVAKGTRSLDVTASVRAWLAGQPNRGWLIDGAGQSTAFRSLEWRGAAERPLLTILP